MHLLLWLLVFAAPSVFAKDEPLCSKVSQKLVSSLEFLHTELNENQLSLDEREKIRGWFKETKLASVEEKTAAKKAFDLVFEKMLALHPEESPLVRKISQAPIYEYQTPSEPYKITGAYGDNAVKLKIPSEYRGSIIEYKIRIHENFHALEEKILLKMEPDLHEKLFPKIPTIESKQYRYLREVGAIMAEWSYLNSIPVEVRTRMIEKLQKDPSLSQFTKEHHIRTLRNASLDQLAYLEREHEAGRYSYESLVDGVGVKKSTISNETIAVIVLGGGAMGGLLLISKCNTIKNSADPSDSDILFYRSKCMRAGYGDLDAD